MRPALIAALLLCFQAVLLEAQEYAGIRGCILDPSGASVPGALVLVINEDTGFRRNTTSGSDCGYAVAGLEPGTYKVTVRRPGFRTTIRFGVKTLARQPARVDFTLAIGSMLESVTVVDSAAPLDSEEAALGTWIGKDRIANLPLNGNAVSGLLDLAPGMLATPATRGEAGQFTVNGQRPNTNYFTIDGVSLNTGVSGGGQPAQATGAALPGMTAFGSLHGIASLEAIDEFRVQTSMAGAEFGRLPGAQVSLRSRSGSNQFHGSLFDSFRNEAMDANDWFANRNGFGRSALRLQDGGIAAGGPVRRDHTFFFASYELIRLRQPFSWMAAVPSSDVRDGAPAWIGGLLGLFPEPNGPALASGLAGWTARGTRPSRLNSGSLRLDHALTGAVTLFARYSQTPSRSEFGSAQVSRLRLDSRSLTAGLNARFGAGLVLDLRAGMADATADSVWTPAEGPARPSCDPITLAPYLLRDPTVCDQLIRVGLGGAGQVFSGREGRRRQGQAQVLGTFDLTAGTHHLRAGGDYLRLAPRYRDPTGNFSLVAETPADLTGGSNYWTGTSLPQYGRVVSREFAFFAQDSWRVGRKFTASYGLRAEFSPATVGDQPAYALDPLTGEFHSVSHPVWPPRNASFAPRLGIAYRPGQQGRTVLRAGAGLFYDSSPGVATDLVNRGPLNVQQYLSGRNAPFSSLLSYGFLSRFHLPRVAQWNASVEHAFSQRDTVSAAYVGSAGRHLIRREMGGPGSTDTVLLASPTDHGASRYHGLQIQYRRTVGANLQALLSYSWSHSIDNSSTDSLLNWAGTGFTPSQDRGSSDFDVRHTFTAGFTYQTGKGPARGTARLLRGWALDGLVRARTGFPVQVLNAEEPMGLDFANVFRPDLVTGQPVWVADAGTPSGRRLNPAAFLSPADGAQGTLGRNSISGFGMFQADLALRREFALGEERSVQLRVEAFNALNHPNPADPVRYLSNPLFGTSVSMLNLMLGTGSPASGLAPMFQCGGPRSLEIGLRFRF